MNSKRSMWKLLAGVAGVGFLFTNCTIKSATDDDSNAGAGNTTNGSCSPVGMKVTGCTCPPNNLVSYQVCTEAGIYGECVCAAAGTAGAGNGGASNGGASNVAGTANGGASDTAGAGGSTTDAGASSSAAGENGEGGEGGEGGVGPVGIDPTDCYGCLNQLCAVEWDFCVAEDEKHPDISGKYCLSENADGTGQIEAVLACIEAERSNGLVKRDAVRACGSSLGKSTDPSFFEWPPEEMTPVTAQVLNCMADSPDEVIKPGRWADSTNIPTDGSSPTPWLDMTCAKLACTSSLK